MKINTYLYKNKKIVAKHLNIIVSYDKNIHRFEFEEENSKIQVTFDENQIEYIRNNNEYIFKIKYDNKKTKSTIEVEGKEFLIEVIKSAYKVDKNRIYLSYIIETDIDNENEIIIEFVN